MSSELGVLVTGAGGFIGSRLLAQLNEYENLSVSGSVRAAPRYDSNGLFTTGNIDSRTDWAAALKNRKVVVHAAAKVHVMNGDAKHSLAAFREVNVLGTLNLARQAVEAGVNRFIFISSIKVNGELTSHSVPFTAEDVPSPQDAYAVSKFEAEQALLEFAQDTNMDIVIIRPPLVYGPGVKGNFSTLIELMNRCLPLPLGAVHNKRSLLALDNLVDLVAVCIHHPRAANQIFVAGDGQDLSTTELLQKIGKAVGKRTFLVPVPSALLMFCAGVIGKKAEASRLLSSLQVDISKAQQVLGWTPPISVEEGLRRCFDSESAS